MTDRQETMSRYLAIWNGEEDLESLGALVAPGFVGHIGSRDRDLERLKDDIAAYRRGAPSVRFVIHHQFGEGEFMATRVTANAKNAAGEEITLCGINISRWEAALLAEEWAVWETLPAT